MVFIQPTYQLRGYMDRQGYAALNELLGRCADLYNTELEVWRDSYEATGKSPSRYDRQKAFTQTRRADTFWGACSQEIGRGVLTRFERAKNAFYRRCKAGENPGYPRFKPRHRYRTLELGEAKRTMVKGGGERYWLKVKGLPRIRLKSNRELPSPDQLKALRLTFRGRRLIVNLTYAVEQKPLPLCEKIVGLDMGVLTRITTSAGHTIERRQFDRESIKKKQRRLSACRKGSRRYRRRRRILANAHYRAYIRDRNECHRITTELIRKHGLVAVERLNTVGMTKAGGMRKRGLNRAILEQTWGRIHLQLAYKAEWAGRMLVFVDPKGTSQECSGCGRVVRKRLSERRHVCACGLDMDRDHNAARNVLRRALAGGTLPAADLESAEMYAAPLASGV